MKYTPVQVAEIPSKEEVIARLDDTIKSIIDAGFDVDMLDALIFSAYIENIKARYGSVIAVRHATMMLGQFSADPNNFKEIYH